MDGRNVQKVLWTFVWFVLLFHGSIDCKPQLYPPNAIDRDDFGFRYGFSGLVGSLVENSEKRLKEDFKCGYEHLIVTNNAAVWNKKSDWEDRASCLADPNSCTKPLPDKLNVHIVPHTHDDVGWLKTVDQYYYGSKTLIQKAGVQYIIDSVVQELLKDPKKKFIYVESAFFFKWWREQDEELQEKVKQLVNEGRLEFIGGAWSMNDEATTHYQSIIDQFAWGLRRLNDTFGKCGRPRIGWQIDPFGHSREMASMFAHMGYDGLFFGRLDYEDKNERLKTKTAEMIWKASANQGESSDLFTGALYNQYQPPPGFCFDILCADEPIIDGKHSPDYNVDRRVNEFLSFINKQRQYYKTNKIILTMGGDFTYQDANVYYKNLDKLIRYANERQSNGSDVNLFYSTPSCYLKSLHDANEKWPTKSDDFFPYSSDPHAFWTGYFTSRPTLKRFERVGNHFLQINKQLTVLAPQNEKMLEPHLTFMRETMGIMQHHDAVTGTEKEKVAYDYAKRLDVAMRACNANARAILNAMVTGEPNPPNESHREGEDEDAEKIKYKFEFASCPLLNISRCDVSESSSDFTVTIYNPLSHSTFQYVRVPVADASYQVMDYRNVPTESQVVPVPSPVKQLKFRSSNASYELVFLAAEVPPLGYKSYYISKDLNISSDITPQVQMVSDDPVTSEEGEVINIGKTTIKDGPITIGNKYINITFDENGILSSVASNGIQRSVSQKFYYYEGATGNNKIFANRSSGAYIFRPNNTVHEVTDKPSIRVIRGPAVEEVHQTFNDWISQVVRVYQDDNHAEFEWMVGPIPIDDGIGKEVITRFDSDIKSKGVFYTDSNGREMIRRERNKRSNWEPSLKEKVAGNYYPLTTKIALEDDEARMAVLVDRAQGGSSLADGSIEIMIHRRLLHDDAFGVEEALNETSFGAGLIARGQHYLILGPPKGPSPSTTAQERFLQLQKLLPNWLFFSNVESFPYNEWRKNFNNIKGSLANALPQNINLMTLEPWHQDELLIRFEHILEKDEDDLYSKPFTFNLNDILRSLKMESIRETTLDGNLWLDEMSRLKFAEAPSLEVSESGIEARNEIVRDKDQPVEEDIQVIQIARKPLVSTEYTTLTSEEKPSEIVHRSKRTVHIKRKKEDIEAWNARSRALGVETLPPPDSDPFEITLAPMQIRTFVIKLEQQI